MQLYPTPDIAVGNPPTDKQKETDPIRSLSPKYITLPESPSALRSEEMEE